MILRSNAPAMQVARFVSHYVQMSIAMYLGMLLPVGLLLSAFGLSSQSSRSPEASALLMTGEMVLGMAAWMAMTSATGTDRLAAASTRRNASKSEAPSTPSSAPA